MLRHGKPWRIMCASPRTNRRIRLNEANSLEMEKIYDQRMGTGEKVPPCRLPIATHFRQIRDVHPLFFPNRFFLDKQTMSDHKNINLP
jgi:hypothetical protein